jgi:hypothetical protein
MDDAAQRGDAAFAMGGRTSAVRKPAGVRHHAVHLLAGYPAMEHAPQNSPGYMYPNANDHEWQQAIVEGMWGVGNWIVNG